MAINTTTLSSNSPSPSCMLVPQEPLLPWISDNVLAIILPTIVYAVAGAFFHFLDTYEIFTHLKIHPTEDELKRNHVTKWQCLKVVVRYHVMQISVGLLLNAGNGPAMIGDEACKIHTTALALRSLRSVVPLALTAIGIDAKQLSSATQGTSALLAHVIAGHHDQQQQQSTAVGGFESTLAHAIITFGVPMLQYAFALIIVDTWIYFTHRLCHVNRTLYRIVHAQHHRLYVSYAYGAVYAHWLETLFLDILSFVLAGQLAQLSARQSMLFGALATVKTISDHCGYVFPWDPFGWVNGNGAEFHDLHHQSWGLKYNFSTYTVFWDKLLGTAWSNKKSAEAQYSRVRSRAAKHTTLNDAKSALENGKKKAVAEW